MSVYDIDIPTLEYRDSLLYRWCTRWPKTKTSVALGNDVWYPACKEWLACGYIESCGTSYINPENDKTVLQDFKMTEKGRNYISNKAMWNAL